MSDTALILTIVIIVFVVVVLAVLIPILVRFVFIPRRYKKQIKGLENKYYYLDALFRGQDSQYVHRLESISRTNLLYVDLYSDFSSKYQRILDYDDKYADDMIKQLTALLNNKQYKSLKTAMVDAQKALGIFEKSVNEFDAALLDVIRPEEESRKEILKLKENYRAAKQHYYDSQNELDSVSTSFLTVFDNLDKLFKEFDDHIDSAEYEDANALLPTIDQVINSLDYVLKDMPNLCILVTNMIPNQIQEVTDIYNDLIDKKIPLDHLGFKTYSHDWQTSLDSMLKKLKDLDISGVAKQCTQIQKEVEKMKVSLLEESQDKDSFVGENSKIYKDVSDLDKKFIDIVALLPEAQQIYRIDQPHLDEVEELKVLINKVTSEKRNLDTIVRSSSNQPFSSLYDRLTELETDYAATAERVDNFMKYLDSLKESSENAYTLIFDYYNKIKEAEYYMRSLSLDDYFNQYQASIEIIYQYLNEINDILRVTPIDVASVNDKVASLKAIADPLILDVDSKYKEAQLAETSIVFVNRDRNQQNDVHRELLTLEKQFFQGNFESVHNSASSIYRSRHIEGTPNGEK
ncbi:MAG: septation ring formation regulator EzrA [Coprobacillus sp.]|nr:septation ring formation regulator EzrA [Coprobacillus sp.]